MSLITIARWLDMVLKATNATTKISDLESLRVSGFFVPSRFGFLGWLVAVGGWVGLWVVVVGRAVVAGWLLLIFSL